MGLSYQVAVLRAKETFRTAFTSSICIASLAINGKTDWYVFNSLATSAFQLSCCYVHVEVLEVRDSTSYDILSRSGEVQVEVSNNLKQPRCYFSMLHKDRGNHTSGMSLCSSIRATSFPRQIRGPMPNTKLCSSISAAFSLFSNHLSGRKASGSGA